MMIRTSRAILALIAATALACMTVACAPAPSAPNPAPAAAAPAAQIVMFSITSDPVADPHSVTMALQLAGHSLDAGRDVVLFFNVRGTATPTRTLPEDLAFHADPIASLLRGLIGRGAQVHVCPHCMEALGVAEADLIEGARVTTRDALFAKIGPETVVFTY